MNRANFYASARQRASGVFELPGVAIKTRTLTIRRSEPLAVAIIIELLRHNRRFA